MEKKRSKTIAEKNTFVIMSVKRGVLVSVLLCCRRWNNRKGRFVW